jgi:outer membrane protein assembly factor BamA
MRSTLEAFLLTLVCSLLNTFPIAAQVPAQPKIIIEAVEISGAPHLSDAERRQLISFLKQQQFEGNSDEWVGKLERDIFEELPSRPDQDYTIHQICAKSNLISRDSSGDMHVSVTIDLTETPPYRLASIRFENASDPATATRFPADELRKLIPLRDGELFSAEGIREGLDAVRREYGSNGYLDLTATVMSQVHDAPQTVSIVMELNEGQQYRAGSIQVIGIDRTLEENLRSSLKTGDVMNSQVVRDFYTDNKSVLPANALPQDLKVTRNTQDGTVDLTFDFRAVPR